MDTKKYEVLEKTVQLSSLTKAAQAVSYTHLTLPTNSLV